MRPRKIHYHICWCIFSGYLLVYVHSLSLLSEAAEVHASTRSQISSQPDSFVTCEDLKGVGSFDTTCFLNSNLYRSTDIYVLGAGNLEILPHVQIVCPIEGCTISFNLSGNIKVGQNAAVVAGTVVFSAVSLTMGPNSSLNTSSLGGSPPPQTSGTPVGYDGAGGGHGGRGASCLKTNHTNFWGGDVYAWSTLSYPWAYGSKGGGTSDNHKYGGNGGGRVLLDVNDVLYINGSVTAEGGVGGSLGGGGSGGSIIVRAQKL
ncbi:UNVERIFIED_CONTAM: hypothetical protein Sradi_4897800 [Sesamum radiatum]|uniref:Glycine-rich protein n=1 Tax=Sesamum radiatum TaxID=300843 RepID=A0AAW2MG69_SESRA